MKNIAVLTYDLSVEYHISIMDGIVKYFDNISDVSLIIAPVSIPHSTKHDFDYQYWSSTEVLKNKDIDAFIIVVNSFVAHISVERLATELKKFLPRPIISIAVPLDLETNHYTYVSSKNAYTKIIEHLIKKHNKKKIAFFSAELNGSPESEERFKSYKAALKANGLEFNPDLVFAGDFSPACTHGYIKEHYKSIKDVPFDALLCANDYMAIGAIGAFMEQGIKVPEDVCVFGFDDAAVAVDWVPTASTINQHVSESGKKAAELAYKAITGKKVPAKVKIDCVPIYRQSCGCVTSRVRIPAYYDQTGTYFDQPNTHGNVMNLFGNALDDMSTIYYMLNMSESVTDFNDYFVTLMKNLKTIHISFFAAVFYEQKIIISPEQDFELPNKADLLVHYDQQNLIERNYYYTERLSFNPKEELLPKQIGELPKGYFLQIPLSLQNINYGYLICKFPMNKYVTYDVFIKILANAMVHSYEYSQSKKINDDLVHKNQTLNFQSKTDELTKLFNRRGFLSYAQRLLDLSLVTETDGCVFFFDLDGLKKINDTWGHRYGDIAIQVTAKVLRDAFRKSDMLGRLSGDEFAAFAPGFLKENIEKLRKKIQELNEEYSKKENLPFVVSVSMGVVEYDNTTTDLQQLLVRADSELYEEKTAKAKKREVK